MYWELGFSERDSERDRVGQEHKIEVRLGLGFRIETTFYLLLLDTLVDI